MADSDGAPEGEADEGDLLDAYMDAALGGAPPPPGVFLDGRPPVSPELRTRLEEIHRLSSATRAGPGRGPAPEAEPGLPWERLGDFRLLRTLAAGGMGVVYEAVQEPLGRPAAIKVLRRELRSSPEARERFRREARAVARLRHPGIVSVLASGETGGACWLAMDLVEGRGLDHILREAAEAGTPVPPARSARWGAFLARALAYAHEHGVIHRDVKPSNIWITAAGDPMLLDFGVAREQGGSAPTLTTAFVGSVPYAAPEQLAGRTVDGRVDVYGLGVTLYQCLTGELPFDGNSVDRLIHRVLHEEPRPPRRRVPAVPGDLDVVVLKALEKEPEDRYASAAAFAEDLEAVLEFRPVKARPPGPLRRLRAFARARPAVATALAAAVIAAAGAGWMAVERERSERERLRTEAAAEIHLARERLASFSRRRGESEQVEREVADLRDLLVSRWMPPEKLAALDRGEDALHALRRDREADFHAVLDHLRRAERLDTGAGALEEVRVRLFIEKWRDADAARDAAAAEFFRGLAEAADPGGDLTRGALGGAAFGFESDPPGAEVFLFRFREQADVVEGGERRLVPVPAGDGGRGPGEPVPGAAVLRVVGAAGDLAPGDLVLSLEGRPVGGLVLAAMDAGEVRAGDRLLSVDGVPARDGWAVDEALRVEQEGGGGERVLLLERGGREFEVRGAGPAALGLSFRTGREAAEAGGMAAEIWSGGRFREGTLPEGLLLRDSVASPVLGPASRIGTTPLLPRLLEPGSWLAVYRGVGREEVRLHFIASPGQGPVLGAVLPPLGEAPPGFLRIQPVGPEPPFRILEHEITAADWLHYLNDPTVQARFEAEGAPLPVPRSRQEGLHWARGGDRRFELHPEWKPDWPVLGVSYDDALAYAAWRTERDRPLGGRGTYALPSMEEWTFASGNGDRSWAFGNRFRPAWAKSCFSRSRAFPEPILRFPADESPFGVFDLTGGVSEWVDDWYDRSRGLRRVASGCWAWADPLLFRIWGGLGWYPSYAGDEVGFRLVLREEGARAPGRSGDGPADGR